MSGTRGATPAPALLDGIRVVELGQGGAVPYAGRILADLGATVIKVEPLAGDYARRQGANQLGSSGLFEHVDSGKSSIAVDARTASGLAVILDLVRSATCVTIDETSECTDYPQLRSAMRADGAILSITPYGLDSPESKMRLPARSLFHGGGEGFRTPQGSPRTSPPVAPSANIGTLDAGVAGAFALLLHLVSSMRGSGEQARTEPRLFDLSSLEVEVALGRQDLCAFPNEGRIGNRDGEAGPFLGLMLRCEDGEVTTHLADQHWPTWCRLMGRPELVGDALFATAALRAANVRAVVDVLEQWTLTRSRQDLEAEAQPLGLPLASVQSPDEVLHDSQLLFRQFFADFGGEALVASALPIRTHTGTRWMPRSPAPRLGQQTAQLLSELGYSPADIETLYRVGVVA